MTNPMQLDGLVFIIHNKDCSRASCGVITMMPDEQQVERQELVTTLEPTMSPDEVVGSSEFLSDTMGGEVKVLKNLAGLRGLPVLDGVCYLGYATGLKPDVESYLVGNGGQQCNVTNGCGAHIHNGWGCATLDSQGGHYYERTDINHCCSPNTISDDPWQLESYYTTDTRGTAALIGCAITGNSLTVPQTVTDYRNKPFIVHNTDGGRELCGVLQVEGETLIDIPDKALEEGFTVFVELLTAADYIGDLSDPEGPYTVFAPTDDAFDLMDEKFLSCLLASEGKAYLENFLSYHVTDGEVYSQQDFSNGQEIGMSNGDNIAIDISTSPTNTLTVVIYNSESLSKIVAPNRRATNGVLHGINKVLMPLGT